MAGQLQPAGAAAVFLHLARGVRRGAIDRLEMIGDVAIREVLELAAQHARTAADRDRLVYVPAGPLGGAAIVQPQLKVGIPVGGADPATEMPRHARYLVAPVRQARGAGRHQGLDLARQLWRDALVGVER